MSMAETYMARTRVSLGRHAVSSLRIPSYGIKESLRTMPFDRNHRTLKFTDHMYTSRNLYSVDNSPESEGDDCAQYRARNVGRYLEPTFGDLKIRDKDAQLVQSIDGDATEKDCYGRDEEKVLELEAIREVKIKEAIAKEAEEAIEEEEKLAELEKEAVVARAEEDAVAAGDLVLTGKDIVFRTRLRRHILSKAEERRKYKALRENSESFMKTQEEIETRVIRPLPKHSSIYWFSALPPQTLKNARTYYIEGIGKAALCVTLQSKLMTLSQHYKELKQRKISEGLLG